MSGKRDPDYLKRIRALPCLFEGPMCEGPIEAHHITGAGLALKADDRETVPLCHKHHMERHDHTGVFHQMTKSERKEWERRMVAHYQSLLDGTFTDPF